MNVTPDLTGKAVTGRSGTEPAKGKRFGKEQTVPGTLAETVPLIEAHGGKSLALPADLENEVEREALVGRVAMYSMLPSGWRCTASPRGWPPRWSITTLR